MNLFEFNKQYVHSRCRIWPGFYTKAVADIIDPSKARLIFGDNTERSGQGGQAIIRFSPCAFGISTKRKGRTNPNDYFVDGHKPDEMWIINDINHLHTMLWQNPELIAYFPEHGLGTGLSEMPNRCPLLFKQMNDVLYERFGIDYRIEE